MPKPTKLSDEQLDWLADQIGKIPYTQMARHIGIDVVTLKRILMREGLAEFEGAKYTPAPTPPQMWTRPCISCGCTKPRERHLYLCHPCRKRADEDSSALII